jgi:flagellar basal-body rod protein FlgF
VLDSRGRDIVIPQDAQEIPTIAADGTISVGQQQVAKIDLVTFENEQELRKTAQGLYATTQEPQVAPASSTLAQGMLEASNVEPIVEMTAMMELLRQYQGTQGLMDAEHERMRTAIQRLGRTA